MDKPMDKPSPVTRNTILVNSSRSCFLCMKAPYCALLAEFSVTSAEVLHQHDVGADVVILRVENMSAIGRHGNANGKRVYRAQLGDTSLLARGKVKKLQSDSIFSVRVDVV